MRWSSARRWALPLSAVMAVSFFGVPIAQAVDDGGSTESGPVELTQFTNETTQVFAMPNGQYKLISHEVPVRTEQDGDWVPIDTTLVRDSDGNYAPRATTVPLTLSGGGSGTPLLAMGEDGAQVSMSWESDLPTPTVDGSSLTYPDVRPGVDLVMTAQANGYSQVLVVHDKAAAQALAADPADLKLDGDGLDVTKSSDGAVSASNGEVTFNGAPPVQWDSSGMTGDKGSTDDTGTSEVRYVATTYDRVDANTMEVSVAPSTATLNDASTTYPIYVDPKMSEAGQPHTMTVQSGGWDYYDDTSEPLRVGYCGWSGCTSSEGNARSFISFDLSALTGQTADPHIDNATVKAYQLWNASSSATAVNLTKAGAFSKSGTNYPGPVGTQLQQVSSAAGAGGNNEAWISFSNSNVDAYVSDQIKAEAGAVRFSLSAPSANDKYLWKKFGNTSGTNPTIEVTYDFPPTVPSSLTLEDAVDCNSEITRTTDPYLGLMDKSTDQNPTPINVQHHFEVWQNTDGVSGISSSDTRVRYNTAQSSETNVTSGAWAKFHSNWSNSNSTAVVPDGLYYYRDYASNDPTYGAGQNSAWSGWKAFYVDRTAPVTPTLSSFDYPSDQWGASLASPGTFTAASSSTDVAGFSYSFDSATPPAVTGCDYSVDNGKTGYVPASSSKGTITAPATLEQGVLHTLTVKAFDKAHLMSGPSTTYRFYVPLTVAGVNSSNTTFTTFPKFRYEPESSAVSSTLATDPSVLSTVSDASDSGGQEVVITPATTPSAGNETVVTYNLPVPVPGYYAVSVDLNQRPDGGQVAFKTFDQTVTDATSTPITTDTYAPARADDFVSLGGVSVKNDVLPLSIVVTGKNASSTGYAVSIDKIHLVPLRGAAATSLSAAFDNSGIGIDGSATHAQLTADQERSLSNASMTLAGLKPGTSTAVGGTATVGGVTFTMPMTRTGTNGKVLDNVVSAGQEILLPDNTPVPYHLDAQGNKVPGYVNLLVASTCRTIAPSATDKTHALTVRYTDGTVEGEATADDNMVRVPEWLATSETGVIPGITLDRYLQGSTAVTSPTPTLYVARFPVQADYVASGYTIKSITLPRIGTDLRGDCSTAALHVFALQLTDS
jgi:hypothetical protein